MAGLYGARVGYTGVAGLRPRLLTAASLAAAGLAGGQPASAGLLPCGWSSGAGAPRLLIAVRVLSGGGARQLLPPRQSTPTPSTLDNSRVSAPERVQRALEALGLPGPVRVFDAGSTHTAQEAADAVGCALGQIVKTLFFVAEGRPTMVLAAGDRQVDTALLAPILGVGRKKLKMGTPSEVLEYTGFPVGGVAPVGWPKPVDVVVDDSLRRFEEVWAAAGASNAVFMARTDDLVRAINGQWASVVRSPE